jgi:peroxiredoxin Q/BCP
MLNAGQSAPEFRLADSDMSLVDFRELRGKRNVVLYFYDKDNLPGSTMEAIEFTELDDDFRRCNCIVLGVSPDDWMSHAEFRDKLIDLSSEDIIGTRGPCTWKCNE